MKKFGLVIVLLLFYGFSFTQTHEIEQLNQWGKVILSRKSDSIRLSADENFTNLLITRIFPYDNQTYQFYGYLRYLNNTDSTWHVQKLTDKHLSITEAEQQTLSPDQWFGALYYQLIEQDSCYTLLGWNGYNQQQNLKVIEVLWFDKNQKPKFGKPIFEITKKNIAPKKRVILTYANDASIALRYDTVWRQEMVQTSSLYATVKYQKKLQPLIFFNHLDPINSMFEGDRRYYYPTTEVIDGYKPLNGKWIFQEDMTIFPNTKSKTNAPKN